MLNDEEVSMKKLFFLPFICLVLIFGCVSNEKNQVKGTKVTSLPVFESSFEDIITRVLEEEKNNFNNDVYHFYDEAVKSGVETYFNKTVSELSEEDIKSLSELNCFSVRDSIDTLKDIQNLFPEIQYLDINVSGSLSQEDSEILKTMTSLRALTICSRSISDLDIAKNLDYFEFTYSEEDGLTEENNMSAFSVLGKDFINRNIEGAPLKLIRITDENRIYEMIITDKLQSGEYTCSEERKVFVSDKIDGDIVCNNILDAAAITGSYISNRIHLADVNFDGQQDILIDNGHFGNQLLVTYTCFLNQNGTYERCTSFTRISDPTIDFNNKKILSVWRNWAASHSWAMYVFDGADYIMTDCLTKSMVLSSEEKDSDEEVWKYTIEKLIDNEMQEIEMFTTKDYTKEQIEERFYSENSYWELLSDKWTNW